jgi:hypothetical protein
MKMKPLETEFLLAVADRSRERTVRDIAGDFIARGVAPKQLWYWLEKWADKDWYEYGVSLDLGWLTEAGWKQAQALKGAAQRTKENQI